MTDIDHSFTFVDLFAGIGGFRFGLEEVDGKCVFSNERNHFALATYNNWHGEKLEPADFNEIDPKDVPEHDLLAAGFPCQPFSLAGVSKNNSLGRRHGLDHEEQGNLFEKIMDLVDAHTDDPDKQRPKVLFLENVKNLLSHNKGSTWKTIEAMLSERDYEIKKEVIDAQWWVPQHRERVYMVCFDRTHFALDDYEDFSFPDTSHHKSCEFGPKYREDNPDQKYMLTPKIWKGFRRRKKENTDLGKWIDTYLRTHAEQLEEASERVDRKELNRAVRKAVAAHAKKRGFGYGIVKDGGQTRTLSARYYKDGSEILYEEQDDEKWPRPRKLTPIECGLLMGFPRVKVNKIQNIVSDAQAWKQFGNAVVPPVITAIGKEICQVPNFPKHT
jgi:DNA (cytosine-5)-methyltransferase 1